MKTDEWVGLYMHIPKTGGSRLRNSIYEQLDTGDYDCFCTQMSKVLPINQTTLDSLNVDGLAHLTLDQAFQVFPTLDDWITENNIDVFTITRNPYERFISCLRFLPTMMQHGIDKGDKIPRYGGSMTPSEFHAIVTTSLFRQQSDWINRDGTPYTRVLRLDEITGKSNVHITENLYCDFSKTDGSTEQVAEHIHKSSYVIPKFTLDAETKKFVQWLWADDIKNPLVR